MNPSRLVRLLLLSGALISIASADTANTQAVVTAATTFMTPLSTTQKSFIDSSTSTALNTSCLYNFNLTNVEVWSNVPVATSFSGATRNGLIFSSMTESNKTNALAVASAALSTTGKKLLDDVRAGDRYISGEVTNAKGTTSAAWGYNKYFIAFIGTPSTTTPFTFQFGGHHLAYNLTYNGTYTSATPIFAGTEPNSWTDSTGTYAPLGTQRTLLESLRPNLTTAALLSGTFSDVVFGPNGSGPGATNTHDTVQPKVYPTSGRGQLYSSLTTEQQTIVRNYIESWVNLTSPTIAAELLAIYESPQALAETYVGYAGSNTLMRASANYFRVDGPRLWIEFSVQGGVYDSSGYHDHGVVRDKLADYGAAYGSTTISTTVRPPTITTQPASTSVATGGSTTLSVVAASAGTGTSTLSYQWYKDSAAISGATADSYPISSATSESAGSYFVRVISTGGLIDSSAAAVTISASSPTIPTESPMASGVIGTSYSQTLAATGGTPSYTWSISSGAIPTGLTFSSEGVLSGIPTASGTFTFTVLVTDSLSATASESFTATILQPLTAFLDSYSLTSLTDDNDGDGLNNLLEFFFAGIPTTNDPSILPSGSFDPATLIYTFQFEQPAILGSVTWIAQYSENLTNWTTATNDGNVTITSGSASDGIIPVSITIPSANGKIFARVVVTSP